MFIYITDMNTHTHTYTYNHTERLFPHCSTMNPLLSPVCLSVRFRASALSGVCYWRLAANGGSYRQLSHWGTHSTHTHTQCLASAMCTVLWLLQFMQVNLEGQGQTWPKEECRGRQRKEKDRETLTGYHCFGNIRFWKHAKRLIWWREGEREEGGKTDTE